MNKTPIILTAFSTNSTAESARQVIETRLKTLLPDRTFLWGFNQRSVSRAHSQGKTDLHLVKEQLATLASQGHHAALVQSMHLLPGTEFHHLYKDVQQVKNIRCGFGLPLFSSPHDYLEFASLLAAQVPDNEQQALLVIGHGTRHPSWTSYYALQSFLREQLGERVFVGTVEHFPDSRGLEQQIAERGYTQVAIIPFFFAGGIHVSRDILSAQPHSWKSRLEQQGLDVTCLNDGIGTIPGVEQLVYRHIREGITLLENDK